MSDHNLINEKKPLYLGEEEPDQYAFDYEPIRGYPELKWTGKRPFRGTKYYPAQHKETYGDSRDGWFNKIYWGDNLQVMSHLLKEHRGRVKLVYIDPPFDSKADYKKKIKLRGQSAESDASTFEEKQYSDLWTNDEYLQFMYERLTLVRSLLAPEGCLYLHCDSSRGHMIRMILDEVFGPERFQNEIIWSYRRWPSNSKRFQSMHDTIFYYTASTSNSHTFNKQYEAPSDSYLKRFGGKTQILDTETGTRKITSDEETKGMPLRDVWDISIIAGFGSERTDYPTQKPEEILERIVSVSTNPGDLVFDCFMGSGTTQAVALKLGRRFLGADINLGAVQTTTKRLVGILQAAKARDPSLNLDDKAPIYPGFEVYTVNHYDFFRNELEAKRLLVEALELQPLPGNSLWDGEADGWLVKILAINRLATAAELNTVLGNLDLKAWERRAKAEPGKPVEKIRFVCMGHDPDLKAQFLNEIEKWGFRVEVEVVDILRDRQDLQFKRDSEAEVKLRDSTLTIEQFYPMNLLQKFSLERTQVGDWRELVDSILIDFHYDGAVFSPSVTDIPEGKNLVKGEYAVPQDAGTIRVKITDLLSESWEGIVGRSS